MKSFTDDSGREWDVLVGRESWGAPVLLFSARRGGENRTLPLAAETRLDAEQLLEGLSDGDLRDRLKDSDPWK